MPVLKLNAYLEQGGHIQTQMLRKQVLWYPGTVLFFYNLCKFFCSNLNLHKNLHICLICLLVVGNFSKLFTFHISLCVVILFLSLSRYAWSVILCRFPPPRTHFRGSLLLTGIPLCWDDVIFFLQHFVHWWNWKHEVPLRHYRLWIFL